MRLASVMCYIGVGTVLAFAHIHWYRDAEIFWGVFIFMALDSIVAHREGYAKGARDQETLRACVGIVAEGIRDIPMEIKKP